MSEATQAAPASDAPASEAGGKKNKKNKQSTKPGDPAPAVKVKVEKVLYPGLNPDSEGKATTKLKEWPKDFDSKVHKQLKRSHFENEAPLLRVRAEEYRQKAAALETEANDCEKGGGKAKGKVKKLRSMMERFAELRADLEKDGVSTDEFQKMFMDALAGTVSPEAKEGEKAA